MSVETVKKILVVDDELETRIFLSNLLKANGFHPVTASNKAEGLKKAVALSPSIIILNVMMPGENGIRLYQSLKQDDTLRQIPVIMLSTLDKETLLKCHNLYGYRQCEAYERNDKFMEKPVQAEDLLMAVHGISVLGYE